MRSDNLFANLALTGCSHIRNRALVQCSSDVNGDEQVDVNDLLALLGSWGSDSPESDIDDNGVVEANDLLTLLDNWGDCP